MLGFLRILGLIAASGVAVLAVMGLAGGLHPRLDLASHFAFPLLIIAATLFSLSLLLAKERPAAALWPALIAAAACAALIAPDVYQRPSVQPVQAGEYAFRLLQFNVWGRNSNPDKAAALIRQSRADVVVMQEVFGEAAGIPDAVRAVFPYQIQSKSSLAILSRWPIVASSLERGVVISATLRTPQGDVPVIGGHYYWPTIPKVQSAQSDYLVRLSREFDPQVVIAAGDFNSTPWSAFLKRQDRALGLERRTRALPTWPAGQFSRLAIRAPFPVLPIDHVYAGTAWRTVSVERGPRAGSDHYPVIVTLARKAP